MPKSAFTDAYASAVELLVRLRKEHGVSQVELAKRLGRPQQFISLVERRQRRLDVIEYYAFLRAIGADPERAVAELYGSLPAQVAI
jgi:transcriptional regulator with XRE-family HTH domain